MNEAPYAVRDGEVVPEKESRLRREMRQAKARKSNRRMLQVIEQLKKQQAKKA